MEGYQGGCVAPYTVYGMVLLTKTHVVSKMNSYNLRQAMQARMQLSVRGSRVYEGVWNQGWGLVGKTPKKSAWRLVWLFKRRVI